MPHLDEILHVLDVYDGKVDRKKKWHGSGYYIRRKEKEFGMTLQEMRDAVMTNNKTSKFEKAPEEIEKEIKNYTVDEHVAALHHGITEYMKTRKNITVLSEVFRNNDIPPSSAIHCTIASKEYMVLIQPTDL